MFQKKNISIWPQVKNNFLIFDQKKKLLKSNPVL